MKEDEEKKKRIEQKMSQTDEKNDKVCIVIRGVNLSVSLLDYISIHGLDSQIHTCHDHYQAVCDTFHVQSLCRSVIISDVYEMRPTPWPYTIGGIAYQVLSL